MRLIGVEIARHAIERDDHEKDDAGYNHQPDQRRPHDGHPARHPQILHLQIDDRHHAVGEKEREQKGNQQALQKIKRKPDRDHR